MIKPPKFWYDKGSFISFVLFPFSFLYGACMFFRRQRAAPHKSRVPVICCGNITLGGAGKTPTALWLGQELEKQGVKVVYLSRGWGGSIEGPIKVDPEKHTYHQVGDEPLLLARQAVTIVSKNKILGSKLAEENGADVIIMDDGFQNQALHKDFSLLVLDGLKGLGNGRVFPAGPLREGLKQGLKNASAILVLGEDRVGLCKEVATLKPFMPLFRGKLKVKNAGLFRDAADKKWVAFAGIGVPQKFFDSLDREKFKVVERRSFPDHCSYTDKDIQMLQDLAIRSKAQLITTAKDWVKLPSDVQKRVQVFEVTLEISDGDELISLVGY